MLWEQSWREREESIWVEQAELDAVRVSAVRELVRELAAQRAAQPSSLKAAPRNSSADRRLQ